MIGRLQRVLLLALLLPLQSLATSTEAPPVASNAAAFDRLFTQLDMGALTAATPEQARDRLARLHRLLPARDAGRDLQYRYLSCRLPSEDAKSALESVSRGLADARQLGDTHAQVRFLFCRAGYRARVAASAEALEDWEAGLQLARSDRDWRLVADGLIGRGHVRSMMGEHARALNDFLTAQQLYRTVGKPRLARNNIINLGIAYRRMGEHEKALEHLQQGLAEAVERGDWSSQMTALLQQGFVFEELDQSAQAQDAYERLLKLARQDNARGAMGAAHLALAGAHVGQRRYREALSTLDQAKADFAAVHSTSSRALMHLRRGEALAGLGRHTDALREFDAAAVQLEANGNDRYLALLFPARSRSYEALGQLQLALQDYRRFLALQQSLLDSLAEQRTMAMRHQFDASRRELDTQRLLTETELRQQELEALIKARRWQWLVLTLGAALALVLLTLVIHQVPRTRRLRSVAMTDELTRIANRRSIESGGKQALAAARSSDRPLTLLILDIDHFKQVNDLHGHPTGDQALVRVAAACQDALRQVDQLGRLGGEEFLAVLPDTDAAAGVQIAERLRDCVESLDLDGVAPGLAVTISVGMATLHAGDADFEALLHRADLALYRAKAGGRNRVERDDADG